MRGTSIEFYEVNRSLELPSTLKVGALYFVKEEQRILVNHGDGIVRYYGTNVMDDLLGILTIDRGGTGGGNVDDARRNLGILDDLAKIAAAIQAADQTQDVAQIRQQITTLESGHNQDIDRLEAADADEASARQSEDAALSQRINNITGVQYLPAYDFGVAVPGDQALSDYALAQPGIMALQQGLDIINLFDSQEWIYNATMGSWVSIGQSTTAAATNETLGVVQGGYADGQVQIEAGVPTMPLATDVNRGAVKTGTQPWALRIDENGTGYINRSVSESDALFNANQPSGTNPFATKSDLANLGLASDLTAETAARVAADESLQAAIEEEVETRRQRDQEIEGQIASVIGKLRYMPANNFGTTTPEQGTLTNWALQHTGLTEVENGTSVVNLFDNQEWVYNDGLGIWVSLGSGSVSTATNTELGVVKGGSADGDAEVRVDGTILMPLASITRRGAVKVKAQTQVGHAANAQQISVDVNGIAYFPGMSANQIYAAAAAVDANATNKFVTLNDISWNGGA
jgi:hypothetical protein